MSGWDRILEQLEPTRGNLPPNSLKSGIVPGAFRTGLIDVRKEIREARKAKEPHEDKLRQLYALAALEEWVYGRRGKSLDVINVAVHFPRKVLARLVFPYEQFGYEHVAGLKVTDVKWLVAAFGEPAQHRKPSEIYEEVYAVARGIEEQAAEKRSRPFYEDLPPETRAVVEQNVKKHAAKAQTEFEKSQAERNRARQERQEAIRRRKEREANGGIDPKLAETARKAREGGCLSVLVLMLIVFIAWL